MQKSQKLNNQKDLEMVVIEIKKYKKNHLINLEDLIEEEAEEVEEVEEISIEIN